MYWKSFFIFISDKLINELTDFEYQKRYKVAKTTESVDLVNCILLDDERILSSHNDSFLRLWSSSYGECFMNWFSLIFDSSSYKHGWWMLKWKFVCLPFCHFFFWQIYKCQKSFHFGFGNFHVFVKKKLCQRPSDPLLLYEILLFTFHITIFSSETTVQS